MVRSVKVELSADPAKFVTGLEPAKRTGREFQDQLQHLDTVIRKLPDIDINANVGPAEAKLRELRQELSSLTDERVGVSIGGSAAMAQIERIKLELKSIADTTANVQVRFDANRSLAELEKLSGKLKPAAAHLGENLGRDMEQALTPRVSTISALLEKGIQSGAGEGIMGIVTNPFVLGAIASTGPALGAMVGGALLTGIGLAGIGAGIAGQIHSPFVMAAAKRLGLDVSTGFKDATSGFEKPVHDALDSLDQEWRKLQPGLKGMFDSLAPLVPRLTTGVSGFIGTLVPGLEKAAVAAKPLVDDFSAWLPRLGGELSGIFDAMAKHAGEAREGLALLTFGVDVLLNTMKNGIAISAELFKWTQTPVTHWLAGMASSSDMVAKSLATVGIALRETDPMKAATDWGALETRFTTLAKSSDTLAMSMSDAVVGAMMGVDRANIAVQASFDAVTESIKKNGRSLDIGTEKGRANRTAVLDSVAANIRHYDSLIQSGVGADDAARAYDADTASLVRQMRQAGLTESQINGLIGKYKAVPDKVNTALAVKGLTDSIRNLTDLLRLLNGLGVEKFGTKVTVTTIHKDIYQRYTENFGAKQHGGIQHFAGGGMFAAGSAGIVSGGGPYAMFGEPGTGASTEGFVPQRGISHMAAGGLLSTIAGWHGYGVVDYGRSMGGGGGALQVNITVTDDTGRTLKIVRQEVLRGGGGNVQLALGKSGR